MYVPLNPNPTYKASKEALAFIEMIENIARNKALYFSYNVDLTKSMQVNIKEAMEQNNSNSYGFNGNSLNEAQSLYPNAIKNIPQFTFNNHLLKDYD